MTRVVMVPCPRCGSWNTTFLDREKRIWMCMHMDCRMVFRPRLHKVIVWRENLEDKRRDCKEV